MTAIGSTLNSSLATVGISVANPVQLAATREQIKATTSTTTDSTATTTTASSDNTSSKKSDASTTSESKSTPKALSKEELRRVEELKRIDANVRAHELAHISAGQGVVTSGPNYTYTYGPDGKQYAVAGEVGIDTSAEREPKANISKGQRIQSAALAPRDPSPQDYKVATTGEQLEAQGRSDLRTQELEQTKQAREDGEAYEAKQKAEAQAEARAKADADEAAAAKARNDAALADTAEANRVQAENEKPGSVASQPAPNRSQTVQAYVSQAANTDKASDQRVSVFA